MAPCVTVSIRLCREAQWPTQSWQGLRTKGQKEQCQMLEMSETRKEAAGSWMALSGTGPRVSIWTEHVGMQGLTGRLPSLEAAGQPIAGKLHLDRAEVRSWGCGVFRLIQILNTVRCLWWWWYTLGTLQIESPPLSPQLAEKQTLRPFQDASKNFGDPQIGCLCNRGKWCSFGRRG